MNSEPSAGRVARFALGLGFALTILVGAFLLFQVQPLAGKFILPWFGGAPAVWTTCMLFFQTALFGGYLYAHLLQRWPSPRGQAIVHLALIGVALTVLALVASLPLATWKPSDSSSPTVRILLLLASTVGLPYLVLAGTSPLIQAWFSRSFPGRSPYRLYALSNIGSLAALLSYPFFFEWAFDLHVQAALWAVGFALYGTACLGCMIGLWRSPARAEANSGTSFAASPSASSNVANSTDASDTVTEPSAAALWLHRGMWLVLPATASAMLLATTNHVCQDVAVVPFLWVIPLTLYLLSFIICFDHERWYLRGLWAPTAALTLLCASAYEISADSHLVSWAVKGQSELQHLLHRDAPLVDLSFVGYLDFKWQLGLCFGAMFCACMVCHGELVRLRPAPRRLTEYYLWIAAGGALGGMLVSLAAPAAFNTFHEWPLGLIACYAVALLAIALAVRGKLWKSMGLLAISPAVVLGLWEIGARLKSAEGEVENSASEWQQKAVERARNFYGVLTVYENDWDNPDQHRFTLQHGGIIHGEQYTDPEKNFRPSNYYVEQSGIGQTINYFRQRGKVRVGVVGLGTGSLAVYARPGDVYRFYEINPEVPRLAKKYFTYLSRCPGKCEIKMGDARLSLEREPPQNYNILALDAFSGDAIPTHMLTREAIDVFGRHLAPDGVLAVHITNSYLRLTPVVKGLADHFGYKSVRIYVDSSYEPDAYTSDWILVTKNDDFVKSVQPMLPWDAKKDEFEVPLWTDRYSNLFRILEYQSPSDASEEYEDDM